MVFSVFELHDEYRSEVLRFTVNKFSQSFYQVLSEELGSFPKSFAFRRAFHLHA
jgi:hypothetical protein